MRDHSINIVEELKPYVPPLVIRRLARSKIDSTQAAAERYSAAVLFVDITGYSALAEGLSHKRFEGVEELAAFLNQGFELLIQIVEEHGGEVTKFAGDALVAIWPVPQSMARVGVAARQRLSDHVLLAAQCAFSIHERVTASLRSSEGESLLRLGIAAGDVYVVHLGGVFDRWEFLLSGEPMVQMSRAKDLALAGEVVIDPAAWSLIQDRCSAELNDANFANIKSVDSDVQRAEARKLVVHDSMAQHLRSYVPAAITRRLEAGYGAWLSENRHLSIIFVKLPGYGTSITHPYATTVPEAQAVMRAMQRALYRFEGSINKFNVDDKGITLVAAMGLPPLAHEDDPSRAVLAALELQKVLDILDRPCAIGVSTGWTFCGPIGNQSRREYTIVGNSVNRAARLMQIAERRRSEAGLPSYVLCDEETYVDIAEEEQDVPAQARSLVFERLTGVVLKGRKDAVTAYRPHLQRKASVHPASHYRSRAFFVGRKVERRALKNYLRALTQEDNYSATVIIEGEQGVGKSALIGEILRDASAYDIRTLTGAGEVSSQSKAYHAWRPIFEQIFRIDLRYDDIGSRRRKVMRKLPALPGEKGYPALALKLTPLLNEVLGLNFSENKLTKSMSPEVREQSTRLFLVRLLQQSFYDARRHRYDAHIIFLDNGQWIDDDSWRLALTVMKMVQPLLLLIASRPLRRDSLGWEPSDACQELLKQKGLVRDRLGRMNRDDIIRFHADLVEPCSLSPDLEELLWQSAGGNLLLAQELVDHWRSKGLICTNSEGEAAQVKIDPSYPIPRIVRKMIIGRLDRLSPSQQMAVKTAASLAESFSLTELEEQMTHLEAAVDVSAVIESLVELGIFKQQTVPSDMKYSFAYELLGDGALDMLTIDQKQRLQSAIFRAS